jgi:hypothetical protein
MNTYWMSVLMYTPGMSVMSLLLHGTLKDCTKFTTENNEMQKKKIKFLSRQSSFVFP